MSQKSGQENSPACCSAFSTRRKRPLQRRDFDLLQQASRSLLHSPYAQRRVLLDGLALTEEHLSIPPAFPGQARALTEASRELGLEGVVFICSRTALQQVKRQRKGESFPGISGYCKPRTLALIIDPIDSGYWPSAL
jgi:hypothetical protein